MSEPTVYNTAKNLGFIASSYAECPFRRGDTLRHPWIDGYIERCVLLGIIPQDTPPHVLGRIAFLQGKDINDAPACSHTAMLWARGWLYQKHRGAD